MEHSSSFSVQCVRRAEQVVYRIPSGLNALVAFEKLRGLCDEMNIWTRKDGEVLHFRLAHDAAKARVHMPGDVDEPKGMHGIRFEVCGHTHDSAQLQQLATESYSRATNRKGFLDHLM